MKKITILLMSILAVMTFSCTKDPKDEKPREDEIYKGSNPYLNPALTYGVVKDIDGNVYPTIKIGETATGAEGKRITSYSKVWMAENLKTTKYNDGTIIPNVTVDSIWSNLSTGAWCNYDNDVANDTIYGKLYNWFAVNTGKLCPKGWHIPTYDEWAELSDYLGEDVAGIKMKSKGNLTDGTGLWKKDTDYEGTNESGFTGLPGDYRNASGPFYSLSGEYGNWWSSTVGGTSNAWGRELGYINGNLIGGHNYKRNGLSCRCVQD